MTNKKSKPADYLFWAVKQQTGNSLRNLILIILADHYAGRQGSCYPSHATIAKRCDCSARAVRTQIAILEKDGWISVERRSVDGMKTSSIYTLPLANTDRKQIPNDRNIIPMGTEANSVGVRKLVPKGTELNAYKTPNETPIIKHPIKHTPIPPNSFDEFYQLYPRHIGRKNAEKAWSKLDPQEGLVNRIMMDIAERVERGHWLPEKKMQFIPHPSTYINGIRWEDAVIPDQDFKQPQDFSKLAREAQDLTENL